MPVRSPNHINTLNKSSFTSVNSGLLQRKCSCGKCSKCQQGNSTQQQKESSEVPPLMHEVLGSVVMPLGLSSLSSIIQPQLKIGQPNDKYEQEADRVAEQVMRMPEPSLQTQSHSQELLQTKPIIQRRVTNGSGGSEIPSIVNDVLRSPGQPLDRNTRNFMESRFGGELGRVQIHSDTLAAKSARAVNAKAYTVDNNIVFGAGQYRPETRTGKQLLAHELTHVFQQRSPAISNVLQRDESEEGALATISRETVDLVLPVGRGLYFELEGGVTWGIPIHTGGSVICYLSRVSEDTMRVRVRKQGKLGLDIGAGGSGYAGSSGRPGRRGAGIGVAAGVNFEAGVAGTAIEEYEFPVSELLLHLGHSVFEALSSASPILAAHKPAIDALMASFSTKNLKQQRVELQLYAQASGEITAAFNRPSSSVAQNNNSDFVRDTRQWIGSQDREFLSEKARITSGDPLALLSFLSINLGTQVRGTLTGGLDQQNQGSKAITTWFVEGEVSAMVNLPIPVLNSILQTIPTGIGIGVGLVFISEPGRDVKVKLNVYIKSGEDQFFRGSAYQQTLNFDLTSLVSVEEILTSIQNGRIPQNIIDTNVSFADILDKTVFWNRFKLFSPVGASFTTFSRRQQGTRSLLSDRIKARARDVGLLFEPYLTLQLHMGSNDFFKVMQQLVDAGQQGFGAVSNAHSFRGAFTALGDFLQNYTRSSEFETLIDNFLDYAYVDQAQLRIQFGAGIGLSGRIGAAVLKARGDLRIEGGGFCELDYLETVGQGSRINLRQFLTDFPKVLDNPLKFMPNCPFLEEIYGDSSGGGNGEGSNRQGGGQTTGKRESGRVRGGLGAGEIPGGSGGQAATSRTERRNNTRSNRGNRSSEQEYQESTSFQSLETTNNYPEEVPPLEFEVAVIDGLTNSAVVGREYNVRLAIYSGYDFVVRVKLKVTENSDSKIETEVAESWWVEEKHLGSLQGKKYTFEKVSTN